MEIFVWKSGACLAIFYAFYKIFIEAENVHLFKRFYLLGSLVISFLIPLITFTEYKEVPSIEGSYSMLHSSAYGATAVPLEVDYLSIVLWALYILGTVYFGSKLYRKLMLMVQQIRSNPHLKKKNIIHVLMAKTVIPHTFLHYIFLSKKAYDSQEIPMAVLNHERAHAEQLHTLDLLFLELLKVLLWFNPFVHLIQKSIKLNHEFLADRAVLQNGTKLKDYQEILLAYSSHANQPALANYINYSSFKKRFTVMKTNTSRKRKLLLSSLLLPLLALLVVGFSETQTIYQKVDNPSSATAEQVAKYNSMANFWNQRFEETQPERAMPLSELNTLEKLYNSMSDAQKEAAVPFPVCNPVGKMITLWIHGYNVKLNNETVSLAEFANAMDRLTSQWSTADFENSTIQIQISDTKSDFIKKLEKEYQKTKLYAHRKDKLVPPPPPPPPAPEAPTTASTVPNTKGTPDAPTPPPAPEPDGKLPRMGVMLINLPVVGPTPDLTNPNELIEYVDELGLPFYHDMKKISKKEALEIARKHTLEIQWQPHADDGEPMMLFTNGC